MLSIRIANIGDIPAIMEFIKQYWREDHIMANDEILFYWQHVRGKEVMYVMAEDDEDENIYGTMGFTLMNYRENPCMSTMMIRSLEHPSGILVGEEMYSFLERTLSPVNVISVGIQKRYAKVLEMLDENTVGKLSHYYMLNSGSDYKIARIVNPIWEKTEGRVVLKQIEKFSEGITEQELALCNPYRSYDYLEHRYSNHPYYQYQLYQLNKVDVKEKGILVCREICANGSKMLHVVDYLGLDDLLAEAGPAIQRLLQEKKYEYIDFYCYGISEQVLFQGGFTCNTGKEGNIIPNHFEPYEAKNIEIYFYAKSKNGIHAFLGMGDQDRPNIAGKPLLNKYIKGRK